MADDSVRREHYHDGTDSPLLDYNLLRNKPSSTAPKVRVATDFEATGRFTVTTGGAGSAAVFAAGGVNLAVGGGAASFVTMVYPIAETDTTRPIYDANPTFVARFGYSLNAINTGEVYTGIGAMTNAGAGHTFINKHIGVVLVGLAATNLALYATQADGTTEKRQSLWSAGVVGYYDFEIIIQVTSATSVTYSLRVDGVTQPSLTLTTNIPSGSVAPDLQLSANNQGAVGSFPAMFQSMFYER